MLMIDKVEILIQEGEGLTVEFKEHFTPRIVEDMAAFANAKGGIIILGVKDDKTIIGEARPSPMPLFTATMACAAQA